MILRGLIQKINSGQFRLEVENSSIGQLGYYKYINVKRPRKLKPKLCYWKLELSSMSGSDSEHAFQLFSWCVRSRCGLDDKAMRKVPNVNIVRKGLFVNKHASQKFP